MAQYTTQTNQFLNTNRHIYEVMYLANGANGDIVSTENRLPVSAVYSGAQGDAFGRLRTADPFTLGDYKHLYAIDPNFIDYTANGGTVTFSGNTASATLSTNNSTSSVASHQTKFYHSYQPGKSQVIFSSVVFGYAQQNVTKRTGYFDDRDGIYFEQVGSNTSNGTDNGTLNFVIRSYTTGSTLESDVGSYKRRVSQSQWNIDPCDGTGPSGFNIDTSKTQLIYIDFQWLGVGRVRVGFVHDGAIILAHEYFHSNVLAEVYLSNPNLPVRCEIRNTGTTAGGSLGQICASVISEGGYNEAGIDWSVYGAARTTATPAQTPLPIIALKLKNTFQSYPNRLSVRLNNLALYAETNSIIFEVVKLPNESSLANNTVPLVWTSADSDSGCEYCVNADSYTSANADRLASGFVPSGASQNSLSPVSTGTLTAAKKNIIVQNYDSTNSEVYAVIVRTISSAGMAAATVAAAIQWREIY
jgi:hypothetical protein